MNRCEVKEAFLAGVTLKDFREDRLARAEASEAREEQKREQQCRRDHRCCSQNRRRRARFQKCELKFDPSNDATQKDLDCVGEAAAFFLTPSAREASPRKSAGPDMSRYDF